MKPEDQNIEPVLEAILMNQNEGMDEMNKNLEAIIVQGEENNLEPILENMIIQNDESQKILTDINNSIKEKNVTPKIEIEVDGATIEVVEGPKGDTGETGAEPTDERLISLIEPLIPTPKDGIDGKDGVSVDKAEVVSDVLDIVLQEIPTVEEIVSQIPIPKDGIDGKDANENEIIKTVLEIIPKPKNGKDGKNGSTDTGKQIVTKLKTLKKGERLSYDDLDNTPDFGFNQASKTVSLVELDDVNLTGVTKTNGKYDLGSGGGGAVSSVNSQTGAVVLTTANIADSANKRYVTDANLTVIGNTSGSNSGDNAVNSLYSGLVSNATHTGDVTGATALTIATAAVTNAKMANMATKTYKGRTTAGTGVPEDVPVATLKSDLVLVKADVGLSNVDNTSDVNKPVSTATQTALDLKQPIVRSTRMGWVFPDNTINGATDIVANKWHTISAMWYGLTTAGDFDKRDAVGDGSNMYFTTANALLVRQNCTVALVNVSSGDPTSVNALTASSAKRAALITEMILFCQTNNFDGVDLDLETFQTGSMSAAQWIDFKTMLQELGDALHAKGLILSIEVPPIWNTAANTESGSGDAWDSANSQGYYRLVYSELNNLPVDQVVIMAYDYQYDYSAGQPNQPLAWLKDILNFARNNFNEDRINIVAGLPSAGYSGATGGYSITGRTYSYLSVQTGFGGASRDSSSGELIWANAGTSYACIDDAAIVLKVQQCENMGIYAHALWHIGNNKYGAATQTIIAPEKKKLNITQGYLMIQDQKTANTAGGSSVAATWNKRDLNTVTVNTITGASVSSSAITLPQGVYTVKARCPAYKLSKHKVRLRNTTDSTTTLVGASCYTDATDTTQTDALLMGQFTIIGTKVFELQHYTETLRTTNGFGVATNAAEVEVYSEIEITRQM